jgi:hypothetical protein
LRLDLGLSLLEEVEYVLHLLLRASLRYRSVHLDRGGRRDEKVSMGKKAVRVGREGAMH